MLQMQAVAQWAAIQRGESDGSWEDDAHEMYIDEDEVRSNDSRSEGEIESARLEMEELQRAVPMLKEHFPLIDRLGEGTFSSVYKAIDKYHHIYENHEWQPTVDEDSLPTPAPTSNSDPTAQQNRVYVAIKRIYVTSSPNRIQNELAILSQLRRCRNVAFLICAFRHEDQVLAVMPYEHHQDFRTYFRTASIHTLRRYFLCLFSALSDSHFHGILHRDVKPANFLFNAATGQGTLCDFGLAEVFDPMQWQGHCLHGLPQCQAGKPHGPQLSRPASVWAQVRQSRSDWVAKGAHPLKQTWRPSLRKEKILRERERDDDYWDNWEAPTLENAGGRIGYLKPDYEKRPGVRASRAGTRGFRAPEVLLKCPDQTVALDVWSAGIILLCFLTRRFPFFNSNDDAEALMELAALFGHTRMSNCAFVHNRTFVSNVPVVENLAYPTMAELVRGLNPKIDKEWKSEPAALNQAIDLLKRCLTLDCSRRITASGCLLHPFFQPILKVA